ncbi:MAG TPA: Maf family protein [Terriglobales bacterium]
MIVLASQSPRRAELLRNAKIEFEVLPAHIPEERRAGERAEEYVRRLSKDKALEVLKQRPEAVVLGSDTTVVVDDDGNPTFAPNSAAQMWATREIILEKPTDAEDAKRMLRLLSGRPHRVLTAVCLAWNDNGAPKCDVRTEQTLVRFSELSEQEIAEYVASGEPMDKAGAYGIQGIASRWIEELDGDYFSVMGLPVPLVYRMLKDRKAI